MMAQRARLVRFWRARSRREQRLLITAALSVGLMLWVELAWLPAWDSLHRARAQLPDLREQVAQLDAVPGRPAVRAMPQAVQAALQAGLQDAQWPDVRLLPLEEPADGPGTRWAVELGDAPVAAFFDWLGTEPPALGLQVEALSLTRAEPGRLQGRVVLLLQAGSGQ